MGTSRTAAAVIAIAMVSSAPASPGRAAEAPPAPAQAPVFEPETGGFWNGSRLSSSNDYFVIEWHAGTGDAYALAVREARERAAAKDYTAACAAFARAARLRPGVAPFDEWAEALEAGGDADGAVAAFRQIVYGTPGDRDSAGGKEWARHERFSHDPATLMRYALLLLRAGRDGEALRAYRWGLEDAVNSRYSFREGPAAWFALDMTPADLDRPEFEAAARTVIGLTDSVYRTRRHWAWPDDLAIDEFGKALAAKPGYGPALLFLGERYWEKRHVDPKKYPAAAEAAWRKAAASAGARAVREKAQEKLETLARRGGRGDDELP